MGWDGWGPQISLRQNVFEIQGLFFAEKQHSKRRGGRSATMVGVLAFGDRGGRQADGWMD